MAAKILYFFHVVANDALKKASFVHLVWKNDENALFLHLILTII